MSLLAIARQTAAYISEVLGRFGAVSVNEGRMLAFLPALFVATAHAATVNYSTPNGATFLGGRDITVSRALGFVVGVNSQAIAVGAITGQVVMLGLSMVVALSSPYCGAVIGIVSAAKAIIISARPQFQRYLIRRLIWVAPVPPRLHCRGLPAPKGRRQRSLPLRHHQAGIRPVLQEVGSLRTIPRLPLPNQPLASLSLRPRLQRLMPPSPPVVGQRLTELRSSAAGVQKCGMPISSGLTTDSLTLG
jgi:hypothetical protein